MSTKRLFHIACECHLGWRAQSNGVSEDRRASVELNFYVAFPMSPWADQPQTTVFASVGASKLRHLPLAFLIKDESIATH
jgi:hypothetical protein